MDRGGKGSSLSRYTLQQASLNSPLKPALGLFLHTHRFERQTIVL
jgi:hypothetical protein